MDTKPLEPKKCANCNKVFNTEQDYLINTSRWRVCDRKNLWFNCVCGSTLMIPKGKYDWYSPEKTMSPEAGGLFNKLGGLKNLPHVSSSIMEIQELLQAPDVNVPILAKKIKHDPLLAANLLEIANNMKSAREPGDRKKIEGIEHAIMYVGKKAVGEIVMTISLQAFQTSTKLFNSDRFWKESFVTAELSEHIYTQWGFSSTRDEVFIGAALCNIGKIVGAIALPGNTDRVEERVSNPKTLCTWPQAEAILKVPDHCLLGEIGGAIWGLPKYVLEAISSHHGGPSNATPIKNQVAHKLTLGECVALANQMAHWILFRPSRMDQSFIETLMRGAAITQSQLEEFAEKHAALAKRAA